MFTLCSIIFAVSMVLGFRFLNEKHKPAILGVYQRKNKFYFLKFCFMLTTLCVRQLYAYLKRRVAIELGKSDDGTIHVHTEDVGLEQVRDLKSGPLAVDAVYFNGTSKTGASLVCGVARRQQKLCDAFMFLKVEGGELMMTPQLPDSNLQQKDTEDGFNVEGIAIKNIVPMRSWSVQYTGEMRFRNDPERKANVNLQLTWSTLFPPFNYDRISPYSMAKDIAREPWSRDYFKMLKKYHQDHYEQMGDIEGTVEIDGKKHELSMKCVRDHSYSEYRNWSNFHRYVYHFIYLENGDCIAVGSVSQPLILSHLVIGYYCGASSQSVWPVTASDFQLYQHGERQALPNDYGFSFTAGLKKHFVHVLVNSEEVFYIGKDREAKFYERWCSYQVDGIKGWGCSEWHYNNTQQKLDK